MGPLLPQKNTEPFDGPVGITGAEGTFLLRAVQGNPYKLAKFRITLKVHKIPVKFCPIVCCSGTFMNDWNRWLDIQLQKCKPFIPTYIRDGQQVLDELKPLVLSRVWTPTQCTTTSKLSTLLQLSAPGLMKCVLSLATTFQWKPSKSCYDYHHAQHHL